MRRRPYLNDDERWKAVVRRDRQADGQFFYAVKTTGVYCRPSCASRRALRENVEFHLSGDAAEAAGFRPCQRCHPDGLSTDQRSAETITKACRMIETAEASPDLATLAKAAGMSPFHFHRVFTRLVGLTPKAYAGAHRAGRVRRELSKRRSVTEAIYEAGFNSNSRFYANAEAMLGMQPNQFRNGGDGATIRFAVGKSSLGSILVGSSEKGVCAILMGDDANELAEELRRRFPDANLIDGGRDFKRTVSKVVRLVERPHLDCSLPLDIRGTAFQQRVWKALREIPSGETRSYSEIARQIGKSKSVRAVASACAANALAIAIPCHRVVHRDGSISGYRWGLNRKRTLLKREAASKR